MKWFILPVLFVPIFMHCGLKMHQQHTDVKVISSPATEGFQETEDGESPDFQEVMRIALDRQCGSCHNSNNSTAKAAALAIFDCTEENWPKNALAEHLSGLKSRTSNGDSFSDREKEAIEWFIDQLNASSSSSM